MHSTVKETISMNNTETAVAFSLRIALKKLLVLCSMHGISMHKHQCQIQGAILF